MVFRKTTGRVLVDEPIISPGTLATIRVDHTMIVIIPCRIQWAIIQENHSMLGSQGLTMLASGEINGGHVFDYMNEWNMSRATDQELLDLPLIPIRMS